MAKQKLNIDELKKTIVKMVKEEVEGLTKEQSLFGGSREESDDINPYFDKIRDKEGFLDWIMSYYFKPANKNKPWFSDTVNRDNVLQFLSKTKSNFPLSPRELVDDWFLKRSLKSSMAGIKDKDLEAASATEKDTADYHKGATPLKSVASDLDVTVAAAQKIEVEALQKLVAAMNTGAGLNLDSDEKADAFFKKVDAVRVKMAQEFTKSIMASRGDIRVLLDDLKSKGIITPKFEKVLTPQEIETLVYLGTSNKEPEEIEEFILIDADPDEGDDNLLKLFQMAVAKKVFAGVSGKRPGQEGQEDN